MLVCSSICAFGQTTSTITGTIRDLTNALVTSGKVTFTLSPSRDTTISGAARFSPQTVTCGINGSGQILNQGLSGACTITMNTALIPTGTYYVVNIYPFNVKTSSFTFYAVLSTYDWSTVVPTPTTSPAQNFVDIFSNQTIAGNKTFSGTSTFSGTISFAGATTLAGGTLNGTYAGNPIFSGNPAFSGNPTFSGTPVLAGGTFNGSYGGSPTFFGNPIFSGNPVFNNPLQLTLTNALFSNGINNNGSGLKHARVAGCTTGAAAGNSCQVAVTWPTPFGDTNYTVACLGNAADSGTVAAAYTYNTKTAAGVNVQAASITANANTVVAFDCIAIHD